MRNPSTFIDNEPVSTPFFVFTTEELALAPEIENELIPAHMKTAVQQAKLNGPVVDNSALISTFPPSSDENLDL